MPVMKPTVTTFDPDEIDSGLCLHSRMPRAIPVQLSGPVTEYGTVTVDGKRLSCCEQIKNAQGKWKLMIPVGEAAYEYGRTYRVELKGFLGKHGKAFPPCAFELTTIPQKQPDPTYAAHDEQALNAAREGMVLLKNENRVLPLRKGSVLNCFGEAQHTYRITATGASRINPRWAPNFYQAVADHSDFTVNSELAEFYRVGNRVPDREMLCGARKQSDTALIFLSRHSGEGQDNRPIQGQYYLTDEEMNMVKAVTAAFDKTVLILNTGYPISMKWTQEVNIGSILYTGFAGMLSSYALVEILDGRTNPSGCLADTWSWDYYDSPVSKNQPVLSAGEPTPGDKAFGVRIYYEEDIYVGYRWFDTFGKSVAYPFGHGLSYTDFTIKTEHFSRGEKGVRLNLTVTNSGTVAGKKVVQLYLSAPDGKLKKPAHVLVDFEKTKLLAPGESQTLSMTVDDHTMASFDGETASWLLEKGEYTLSVGALNDLQVAGQFALLESRVLETVGHYGRPVEGLALLDENSGEVKGGKSCVVPLRKRIAVYAKRTPYHTERLPGYHGKTVTWDELTKDPGLLDKFVSQMSLGELSKLNVCAGGLWGAGEIGCCGHTYEMKKYGMPSFLVSDANAGINISKPNIGFPASSAIAATFNKDIAYTVGKTIAEESQENGIFLNLGPGMNLHRNILCGRHPEYFFGRPVPYRHYGGLPRQGPGGKRPGLLLQAPFLQRQRPEPLGQPQYRARAGPAGAVLPLLCACF